MISVTEALAIVYKTQVSLHPKSLPLIDANGLILAKDVLSAINMPPFRQSAMDGYALHIDKNSSNYQIIDEIKAGDTTNPVLNSGQAVRIFTGARVPDTANSVLIQEHATIDGNLIYPDKPSKIQQNIRPRGEQIKVGDTALKKGTKITPAAIGFLAGLGITEVEVYLPPKVGIILTGSELVTPGTALGDGKIFESNSYQLIAALHQLHVPIIKSYKVEDTYEITKNTISEAIEVCDLVLISGGISVGDYDFVKKALNELNTKELFYKVKQKPGKPLFFGENKNTKIFALPGNPASSLTCFYIYALPLIQKMMGNPDSGLSKTSKISSSNFIKNNDRAQFLKAKTNGQKVEILEGQSSAMLHTYSIANALVYLPENQNEINTGQNVTVIPLPN